MRWQGWLILLLLVIVALMIALGGSPEYPVQELEECPPQGRLLLFYTSPGDSVWISILCQVEGDSIRVPEILPPGRWMVTTNPRDPEALRLLIVIGADGQLDTLRGDT